MIVQSTETAQGIEALSELRQDFDRGAVAGRASLTRASLEPVLGDLGITRVADLTGLDHLGIPVWSAIRPTSRSLCVSAGKGLCHESAWTSAVMESCEQAVAERAIDMVAVVATRSDLARRGGRCVPLERQSRCAANTLSADREFAWVAGLSWKTGEVVFAPYELVGMDMATSAPWDRFGFRMSSVGLASGSCLAGAIRHGLSELVEEDALFAPLFGFRAGPRLAIEIEDDSFDLLSLIDRIRDRGVDARFARLQNDFGMAVVIAALVPAQEGPDARAYFCGFACREATKDAALAALLEAIQSRLTFISGARDDLFAGEYAQQLSESTRSLFSRPEVVAGARRRETPDPQRDGGAGDFMKIVSAVMAGNDRDIYVFPLGGSRYGFETVRVLADDLVSLQEPELPTPLRRRAAGKVLSRWRAP